MNDLTQLNSDVIRAFKKTYPIDCKPDLQEVVSDEVDFYAHVVTKRGIKMKLWEKAGNAPVPYKLDVVFRNTNDYGERVPFSERWHVWRPNEEFQDVGRLTGDYRKADIGIVVTPEDIVHRMRSGHYPFRYPGYV